MAVEVDGRQYTTADLQKLSISELFQLAQANPDAAGRLNALLLEEEGLVPSTQEGDGIRMSKSPRNMEKVSERRAQQQEMPLTHDMNEVLLGRSIRLEDGQLAVFQSAQPEPKTKVIGNMVAIEDSPSAEQTLLVIREGSDYLIALYEPALNFALSTYSQKEGFAERFEKSFATTILPPGSDNTVLFQGRVSYPGPDAKPYTPWKYEAHNWIGGTNELPRDQRVRQMAQARHFLGSENLNAFSPVDRLVQTGHLTIHR